VVFDTYAGADFIEGVLATELPIFCCEALGELEPPLVGSLMILIRQTSLSRRMSSARLLSVISP
jgi:hypothetical protein